ncbi:SDR family oxidoreductase [Alcaligenaceae bacterium LF4-65]|uniref:dTDP-4-dehydrorhamnose reductase n=1 Tax=Zwartia hollandica TaxID=324606 RepID=A0A953NB14_9BURK|nr:SDR family oxidoreductase [Zwartia hollandica]MBZ1351038.1 SDR family oxidoreductase [Zwartia hollandica]
MRVLVIGANGMLGNAIFRLLNENSQWEIFGTARSESVKKLFNPALSNRLIFGIDLNQQDSLIDVLSHIRPDVVVNCVGLIKQLADAEDPLQAIPMNALLPHRLARICKLINSRLIHISTDCVFSGAVGNYRESDRPDAQDLYGLSKLLGEVTYSHAVTLRTSIIGHELQSANGLVGWFLSQEGQCNGYTRAIFSGLPTVVLAQIIRDFVIPNKELSGLYHVASEPISKYELIKLIASVYKKSIDVIPDERVVINRSLNAERFRSETGYAASSWLEMIKRMHAFG